MKIENYISDYCHIRNNEVSINGKPCFMVDTETQFSDFSKKIYKELNLSYSKFFKMDNLSKLAFLGAEIVLNDKDDNENTAIVLTNRASSLDTDRKHQDSIQNKDSFYPSPAVFVYTLPNIAIGEISIKNQIKSENAFFIFDIFNTDFLHNYANSLINNNKAENVLCGWVDYDGDNYDCFMYKVSRKGRIKHTTNELINLYK
ncbi:3-oxoacyl-ACP synthase [Aureibaculum sp. 2210JD6-5]|uniref:3-oxoacyl-ACP synthase n=1 Tax=Aureibaculum sp. 2210JD6-5 TaxID=3103957 RepID=UPI002AAD5EF1|nr:3-oxoacyl-ACP synthase [Aureibaculum sp. 2210JD6-5]MDY7393870.1 3-oxoacyl-ACP synthase [Aureibaculum sp. 2210JD6-5]